MKFFFFCCERKICNHEKARSKDRMACKRDKQPCRRTDRTGFLSTVISTRVFGGARLGNSVGYISQYLSIRT